MGNDKVKDRICESFPMEPCPLLSEVVAATSNGQVEIPRELLKRFRGKKWTEILLDDWINIAGIQAIRVYLSPSSFHYYLPSLLMSVLERPQYLDWGLEALLPQNKGRKPKGEWWHEYFACFTVEQRLAVRLFISYAKSQCGHCSEEEMLANCAEEIWQLKGSASL